MGHVSNAPLTAPARDRLWFGCFILASSLWCIATARAIGATYDEPGYVADALQFWRTGSHALLLRLGTMPLALDLEMLPLHLWERWRGETLDTVADLDRVLPWARHSTLLFWWLLLFYGWKSGRHLGGSWGGRLAVALLAVEPSLLAHASLATTDTATAACGLALLYHFATAREASWVRRVGIPGIWFGLAVLMKASAITFGPACLLVVGLERSREEPRSTVRPVLIDIIAIVAIGLVLAFLYCRSDWQSEPSFVQSAHALSPGPVRDAVIWTAEHLRIFPNAGEGIVRQIVHNIHGHHHGTFLMGETRHFFWYYFPLALSMKTSAPLLLLPLLIALLRPRALANWANFAAAALFLVSFGSHVQLGVRFFLPLIALAAVGLAASGVRAYDASPPWQRRLLAVALAGGVGWTAIDAVRVWPNGICYFNEIWGGTSGGYRLLSDSNYDWGQGLPELARWHREAGSPALDVWYFGKDPAIHQPPFHDLPLHDLGINGAEDVIDHARDHYLAVSMTLLNGAVGWDAGNAAAAFLRTRRPVARTTTFFIYDFTHEPLAPVADDHRA